MIGLQQLEQRQVHFVLEFSDRDATRPIFVVNLDCGQASKWMHVPVRPLPPAALPWELSGGCAFKQMGPLENLVLAALKRKVFFTRPQIENMLAASKVPRPKKGADGGSAKKRDLVLALAKHFLGAELGEDSPEFMDIVDAVTKQGKAKLECPETVLEAVSTMDTENQQAFKDLVMDARQEKEKIAQKELEAVIEEKYERAFAARKRKYEEQRWPDDAARAPPGGAAGATSNPPPFFSNLQSKPRSISA